MTHDEGMTTTRTAIVTGAARGIGRAIALRLATDGHHVAVLDLDESACQVVVDEITEGGGTALAVGVDVSDAEQVDAGDARLDLLVNNAGIIRDNLIFKMSVADWDAVMAVHLRGAFLMTRACQAHMTAQRHGRIVNLS